MNKYRSFTGKAEQVDINKVEDHLNNGATLIDISTHSLFGLNERLKPDSELMSQFQILWNSVNNEDSSPFCYFYFPESNTVVKYLEEKWHKTALLVSNSLLLRDPEGTLSWEQIRKKHEDLVVAIAGCSVGKVIAKQIVATLRPNAIKIADPKTAHVANAPRAGWGHEDIGKNKAIQTAIQIQKDLDPFIKISVYEDGITSENIDDFISGNNTINEPKPNILIEETDDLDAKIEIRKKCRENGVCVIMVSDLGSSVQIDIRRFDLNRKLSLAVGISDELLFQKQKLAHENPGNLDIFYDFAFAMLGRWGLRDEFDEIINKKAKVQFGGVPQLPSTIATSAGWVTDVIGRIALGEKYYERMFFDMKKPELITEGDKL